MIIKSFLGVIIPYIAGVLELIRVIIILLVGIQGIHFLIKNKFDFSGDQLSLELSKSMSLSLSFLLAII